MTYRSQQSIPLPTNRTHTQEESEPRYQLEIRSGTESYFERSSGTIGISSSSAGNTISLDIPLEAPPRTQENRGTQKKARRHVPTKLPPAIELHPACKDF